MGRVEIPLEKLVFPVVRTWDTRWFLLAAGDLRTGYNCMTVSWGGIGVIWDRAIAMVVVRPSRHTRVFMDAQDTFTLSAFPEEHREKLDYCGSHSGREGDKAKACGLTPIASRLVEAPGFEQAELILECRKIYFDDLEPAHFLSGDIESNYPNKDYHRMYFGQIVAVSGAPKYIAKE